MTAKSWEENPPRQVGETRSPLVLGVIGGETSMALSTEGAGALAAAVNGDKFIIKNEIYLRLEEITGTCPANLAVYISLPGDPGKAETEQHLAGIIGLFGITQSSRRGNDGEGGAGMSFSLKISDLLTRLIREAGRIPPQLRIHLSYTRSPNSEVSIRIGKIRLLSYVSS